MILPIVPKSEWRTPSISQPKDMFGNENRTLFRINARANDGGLAWRGWFENRDDADAFLYAAIRGTLKNERELWNLCTPNWQPYLDEILSYEFATVTFLTSPTGSNQTYTFPVDWTIFNWIETIGAGGSGGCQYGGTQRNAAGAGGGGYSKISDYVKPGATTTYRIGTGPGGVGALSGSASTGTTGGDTWFGNTTLATSSVGAKGGAGGGASVTASATGGTGGAAASGIGTTKYSGGNGGNASGGGSLTGAGGGGAAGPNGNGNNGVNNGGGASTDGGSGDNGFGGSGGIAAGLGITGGAGGDGTEFSASYGSGGGGAGGYGGGSGQPAVGGRGGNYGGGGGGVSRDGSTPTGTLSSGAGASGLIVISYSPLNYDIGNLLTIGFI